MESVAATDQDPRLAATEAALAAITRRATRLQQISAALAGALRVEEVVEVVAAHGPAVFGATAVLIYLVEPVDGPVDGPGGGSHLRLAGFGGVDPERVAAYRDVPLSSPMPMADVVRTGAPCWLEDRAALVRAYPPLAAVELGGAPLQALMGLPLRDGAAVIGGLAFSFYEPTRFSAVEREFYLMVATQCAQAVARARLFAAAQRQQQLLTALLDGSAALSETLDSRAALEQLARMVVPGFADWCAIDELAPDGHIRRVAVQHVDPAKVAYAHELARRWPPDPNAAMGVPNVLRTGRTEWNATLPASVVDDIPDAELREIVRALGLTSYAVVPMVARGRVLGALSLVQAESGRRFSADELRFVEDLARRAALALDNARLYESAEASRSLLHGLLMHAPAAIGLTRGREHVYELVNEPYMAFIGERDVIGRRMRDVLPELASQGLLEIHDRVFTTGETFTARELPIRRRWPDRPEEASERHFNVVYQPTRGALGQITGLATFGFEVTAHVVARRELEALAAEVSRSEARMRALVESTAAIVWTATPAGAVVEVSPSWLAFTGQTAAEYQGGGFVDAIHPDDRAATMAGWAAAVGARAPYAAEYRLRRRDGVYAHMLARGRPVAGADGEVAEYIGCNVDITGLRQAEATARAHAETLGTINELGRLISAELDQDTVVQAVTDAATSLTGAQFGAFFYNVIDDHGGRYMLYTISGVPRAAFSSFPMPRNTAIFAPTFAGERVVRSADITADPDYGKSGPHHGKPPGHLPVRSYLAVPVVSRTGEVIGGIFLGHEKIGVFDERAETLTVGLAAQAAVAVDNARLFGQAQRLIAALEQTNRDLDQFAYVTSHDLKAPLRGIASLAEWLEEDLGPRLDDGARKKLDMLRGRVNRMEALIQGILDYSRAGRGGGKREDVAVGKLVAEIAEMLAPRPPAAIEVEGRMPVLHTERVALQQVLTNLIGNALKYAGRADARVRVSAIDRGEWHELRVSDNGPGILPEFQDRIWVIFQTLQPRDRVESTGIGLAIVKKIVENRGGRAWVESTPGAGATFAFTWPTLDDRRRS